MGSLRGVLEASWKVLEASWRCLGGVLGRLGGILDVSWGKCRKKVEGALFFGRVLRAKMEAKIVKIRIKNATCFYWRFLNIFFVIFHVFESQLVKTCIIFSFLFCIDFLLIFLLISNPSKP